MYTYSKRINKRIFACERKRSEMSRHVIGGKSGNEGFGSAGEKGG
jgi:hypothetical protein